MYEDIRQFEFTKVCSFMLGFLSFREKNDFAIRKINYLNSNGNKTNTHNEQENTKRQGMQRKINKDTCFSSWDPSGIFYKDPLEIGQALNEKGTWYQ